MRPVVNLFCGLMPSFTLFLIIGIALSIMIMIVRENKKAPNYTKLLYSVAFLAPFSFIGGKVLYAVVSLLNGQNVDITSLITGGFVFYGGLLGGLLGLWIYSKITKLSMITYTNALVPYLALCQSFGRIGCLLNGCCYGIAADTVLSVSYPSGHIMYEQPCLPTPLFEAIACLMLSIILFSKRFKQPTIVYLLSYSIVRFCLEYIRGDLYRGVWFGMSTSQVISLVIMISVAVYVIIQNIKSRRFI